LRKVTEAGRVHGKWYDDACAATFAMELIGERWTLPILRELMLGGRRFSGIRASLPGLSAKVLTERLQRLEALGVLVRRQLPAPASATVFELTDWGLELEGVMQALARWAAKSPLHDPSLPMTPVSFMLSLRAMLLPGADRELGLRVCFALGEDLFTGHLRDGALSVERGGEGDFDLAFRAVSANAMLPLFYGKRPRAACDVSVEEPGGAGLAQRFVDQFALPPKFAQAHE
jgi:DNA-binding HxlR family transcriptional regulator